MLAKGKVDETLISFVCNLCYVALLASPDKKTIIVPNSNMLADNIINYSTKGTRRVDMVFGIGYEDDIDKARKIISGDDRVREEPKPVIVVSELADSRVNFTVRVWSSTADYWGIYFDTMEKVKKPP